MHVFYSTEIQDGEIIFSSEETNHAKNVLRIQAGKNVNVVDGQGTLYQGTIWYENSKHALVKIASQISEEPLPYTLHMVMAPTKNADRVEWFVEKAIEIGVHKISFVQSERTERKHLNTERLYKIAIAAMKQSGRYSLPVIHEMIKYDTWIKEYHADNGLKFIAHLGEERKLLSSQLSGLKSKVSEITVIIGPEGDFSPEEVQIALNAGYVPVSLGDARLRTETAGVFVCSVCNIILTS